MLFIKNLGNSSWPDLGTLTLTRLTHCIVLAIYDILPLYCGQKLYYKYLYNLWHSLSVCNIQPEYTDTTNNTVKSHIEVPFPLFVFQPRQLSQATTMPGVSGFTDIVEYVLPIIPQFGSINQVLINVLDKHKAYEHYLIARALWFRYDEIKWAPIFSRN